jgi:Putative peptidoglycan binding domain.
MVLAQGSRGSQGKTSAGAVKHASKAESRSSPGRYLWPLTEAAVCSYQKAAHLHVSGRVDAATWARLESRRVVHVHPVTPPAGEGLARLAQQVLALNLKKRVILATVHESGIDDHAQALYNIQDTAAGKQARRSSYANDGLPAAPGGTVLLDQRLLTTMLTLEKTYSFEVSEIAGGCHSANSRHYRGLAVDVNVINGKHVSPANPYFMQVVQLCARLGATELLHPGNDAHHQDHVHIGFDAK